MNKTIALFTVALFGASLSLAAEHKAPAEKEKPVSKADAALIAKARTNYPLKTCLVSDEDLGSMGEATAYVHREAGKPDRVVFFCCDGCIDDFKKEPAKYLKKVDAAAAGKKAPAAKPEKAHE